MRRKEDLKAKYYCFVYNQLEKDGKKLLSDCHLTKKYTFATIITKPKRHVRHCIKS